MRGCTGLTRPSLGRLQHPSSQRLRRRIRSWRLWEHRLLAGAPLPGGAEGERASSPGRGGGRRGPEEAGAGGRDVEGPCEPQVDESLLGLKTGLACWVEREWGGLLT